jgi:ER lumen protein retaining receptor
VCRETDGWFQLKWIVVPAAVLALKWPFYLPGAVWTFSIFLEPLAVLPQLFLLRRRASQADGESSAPSSSSATIEPSIFYCIVAIGGYRGLYILNWIYRAISESTVQPWFVYIAGYASTCLSPSSSERVCVH